MKDLINKKVLVTTQGWFYGKDGRSYKAVHGTLKAVQVQEHFKHKSRLELLMFNNK